MNFCWFSGLSRILGKELVKRIIVFYFALATSLYPEYDSVFSDLIWYSHRHNLGSGAYRTEVG
jgi:hypothetical protein